MGTMIDFSYCVSMNEPLPCRNIVRCWEGTINIIEFLREKFSDDELQKALGSIPKSRIELIIESIP